MLPVMNATKSTAITTMCLTQFLSLAIFDSDTVICYWRKKYVPGYISMN